MEAVIAKDGSKLSINCNRLLNQLPTPECTRTTTTTTTTTTTISTTTIARGPLTVQEFPDHSLVHGENQSKTEDSDKVCITLRKTIWS